MASQTFLGRDIFSAYWILVVLGFLESHRPLTFPATVELKDFVRERENQIQHFLQVLQDRTGLSPEIMGIATAEAPWSTSVALDAEMACSDVALLVGRWVDPRDLESDEVLREATLAAIGKMLDGLAASVYSFGDRHAPFRVESVQVLDALCAVLGSESSLTDFVRDGYQHWLDRYLPITAAHPDTVPDYREWLQKTKTS